MKAPDPPLPTITPGSQTFVGEETSMPIPRRTLNRSSSPFSEAGLGDAPPLGPSDAFPSSEDPFSILMSQISAQRPYPAGKEPAMGPFRPPSLVQRLLPLVHLVAVWGLLGYFVLWREPELFEQQTHGVISSDGRWSRWAELGWKNTAKESGWGVQFVVCTVFFLLFTKLRICYVAIFLGVHNTSGRPAFSPYVLWLCKCLV
jgi:hypothetical protein